jgi:hypothetical protein
MPREEEGDAMTLAGRNQWNTSPEFPEVVGYTLAELRQTYKQVQHLDANSVQCIHPKKGWWHYYFKAGRRWRRAR